MLETAPMSNNIFRVRHAAERERCKRPHWVAVPRRMEVAIDLLRTAYDQALSRNEAAWMYALPIGALRAVGLSEADLRGLVRGGLVDHAIETGDRAANGRSFR